MTPALQRSLESALGERFAVGADGPLATPIDERELATVLQTLKAHGGSLVKDLSISRRRLSSVGPIDPTSSLLQAGAGAKLQAIETVAQGAGLTLGPLSPGILQLELGRFLEGRWAGLRGVVGGRLEPLPLAIRALLPDGSVYASRQTPRSAAGPELDALVLGGFGRVALAVAATLRLYPLSKGRRVETFSFSDDASALRALKLVLADGCWVDRVRLVRRGDRRIVETSLVGTPETVERDARTVSDRATFAGGRVSGHRLEPFKPGADSAPESEAGWDAVAAAFAQGNPLTLYRLSLESVIVQGEVEGTSLAGGVGESEPVFANVIAAIDPQGLFGGKG